MINPVEKKLRKYFTKQNKLGNQRENNKDQKSNSGGLIFK